MTRAGRPFPEDRFPTAVTQPASSSRAMIRLALRTVMWSRPASSSEVTVSPSRSRTWLRWTSVSRLTPMRP